MNALIITILITYLVAINVYGIIILNYQKKSTLNANPNVNHHKISDIKLLFTGALGGAIGIYVFMFIFKYRLKSFFLMILLPIMIAVNVFMVISLLRGNYVLLNFR